MVQSLTLIQAPEYLIELLRTNYFYVFVLLKLKQKSWSHTKKHMHAIYGPGLRFVSNLYENYAVSDRYESNSCWVSDRDEVKPV